MPHEQLALEEPWQLSACPEQGEQGLAKHTWEKVRVRTTSAALMGAMKQQTQVLVHALIQRPHHNQGTTGTREQMGLFS